MNHWTNGGFQSIHLNHHTVGSRHQAWKPFEKNTLSGRFTDCILNQTNQESNGHCLLSGVGGTNGSTILCSTVTFGSNQFSEVDASTIGGQCQINHSNWNICRFTICTQYNCWCIMLTNACINIIHCTTCTDGAAKTSGRKLFHHWHGLRIECI